MVHFLCLSVATKFFYCCLLQLFFLMQLSWEYCSYFPVCCDILKFLLLLFCFTLSRFCSYFTVYCKFLGVLSLISCLLQPLEFLLVTFFLYIWSYWFCCFPVQCKFLIIILVVACMCIESSRIFKLLLITCLSVENCWFSCCYWILARLLQFRGLSCY